MIAFSKTLPNLRRFVYISTAYTASPKSGVVKEEDLPGTVFSNYYEESKAAAENLVRTSDLPWSVCRPGMIVGDSRTGWAKTFNTVYYLLKLMLLGKIRVLPVKKDRSLKKLVQRVDSGDAIAVVLNWHNCKNPESMPTGLREKYFKLSKVIDGADHISVPMFTPQVNAFGRSETKEQQSGF